ncbi:MAG: hypothetical protein IKG21_13130 [Atopobiaceae bacterium]|nr:hypothetical protein [Atopobiaceae bacterium]
MAKRPTTSSVGSLRRKGFFAERTADGTNFDVSLAESYREMRRYGATAAQAYDVVKAYKGSTSGVYRQY